MRGNLMRGIGVAFLLAVLVAAGCTSNPSGPLPGENRNFGAPYGTITFQDDSYLGTVNPGGGQIATFVPNVGPGKVFTDPGFCVLWDPNSTDNDARFVVSDDTAGTLALIGPSGTVVKQFGASLPNQFAMTNAGSRLGYVQVVDSNKQQLTVEGINITAFNIYGTISPPYVVTGRPSFLSGSTYMVVSVEDPSDPSTAKLFVFNSNALLEAQHPVRAIGVSGAHSQPYVAFFDGTNGAEQAGQLVVMDQALSTELKRYSFNGYAIGATALAWSPDDNMIAFYAGVYTDNPILMVVNITTDEVSQVPLDKPVAIGMENQLIWACPDWSPQSDQLVLEVKDGDKYDLITTTLDGVTTTLVGNLPTVCRPTWR